MTRPGRRGHDDQAEHQPEDGCDAAGMCGADRAHNGPDTYVRVLDPVPMGELPAALDSYDLGIYVLAPTSFNNLHALPNKFYDFVQSGLGVVIGPSPEMAALSEQFGLGIVLEDFSRRSLRQALESLDSTSVASWKAASCRASGILSSQHQAERLLSVVNPWLAEPPR